MKYLKLFFITISACLICNKMYARQSDEVTLVVSAYGSTKNEATKIGFIRHFE